MSNTCQICKKTFKYPSLLLRHQRGKFKCKIPDHIKIDVEKRIDNLAEQIEQQSEQIEELKENIQHKEHEKSQDLNEDKYRCRYCCKDFSEQRNLTKHLQEKRCRGKNDNVEIYERELGIKKPEEQQLTCRFCNVKFSKQQSYSRHMNSDMCRGKMKYEHELEKRVLANRKQVAASIAINGNNNNNTTVNNNNIYLPPMNAFGSENLDYITTKMLIKQIELCKDFTDITETVKTFTQLIHAHPAHPENHNVLIKGNNSAFAEIFNGTQFEQSNALVMEDQILQKVGKLLIDKKNEFCEEQIKKDKEIPDKIEKNLIKMEEAVDDNINSELFRDTVTDASRNLSTYRNTVKGALMSKKEEIHQTQQLIKEIETGEELK